MKRTVTTEEFLGAFRKVEEKDRHLIHAAYTQHRKRTERMLGRDGVMATVCGELTASTGVHMEFKREWYTIDALFVSGEELVYPPNSPADSRGERLWYPSQLDVLIEVENDERLEEEMWKLLFWRSGLKVLVGYDFYDDEYGEPLGRRNPGLKKGDWAPRKLDKLREMIRSVHGETGDGSEYLLILGNRSSWAEASQVRWRWCRIDDPRSVFQSL